MASAFLSIGQINITGYMLVILRYTDTPSAEVARQSIAPGDLAPVNNLTFNSLIAKPAFVDVRESPDGIALGTLLSTFQINISDKINILERRFYHVGGIDVGDPSAGSYELEDPYFEDKVVSGLFREGFRYLEENVEWKRVDNKLQLLNPETLLMDGPTYNAGEVYIVDISYLQEQVSNISQEGYMFFVEITATGALTSSNRQKVNVINCPTARIVLTLENIASIVEGDWLEFITNDGNQLQTVIQAYTGGVIRFGKKDLSRIILGTGEYIRIAKKGTVWQVIRSHSNIQEVGRFFKSYNNVEPNALLCDAGTAYNGADYPRILDYIKSLPAGFIITDSGITSGGWVPQSGKDGCWYYYNDGTNEWFRTPNKQNSFSRNLKSFSTRNNDTSRLYDYPGGKQLEMIGEHLHFTIVNGSIVTDEHPEDVGREISTSNSLMKKYNKTSGQGKESYTLAGSTSVPTVGKSSLSKQNDGSFTQGAENRPQNIGEFEFVKI